MVGDLYETWLNWWKSIKDKAYERWERWKGKVKNEPTARFRDGETLGWLYLADQSSSEDETWLIIDRNREMRRRKRKVLCAFPLFSCVCFLFALLSMFEMSHTWSFVESMLQLFSLTRQQCTKGSFRKPRKLTRKQSQSTIYDFCSIKIVRSSTSPKMYTQRSFLGPRYYEIN